jgi:hypothetical protein
VQRRRTLKILFLPQIVESHISRKTSEMWGTLGSWLGQLLKKQVLDLDGKGRRRSAGSGAAKHAGGDSIRNRLLVSIGSGKAEAGAGCEVGRDSNRGDGAKALPKRAGWLAQSGAGVGGNAGRRSHDAGMSTVSPAADGQQLLRCSESDHRRRRQQCTENAQQ